MLRGSPISDEEREELNLEARRLFESRGIDMMSTLSSTLLDYKKIRENDFVGYAEYVLYKCWNESKLKNKASVKIYKYMYKVL